MLFRFLKQKGWLHVRKLFVFFVLVFEALDDGGIGEGRGVAEGAAFGDVAKEPAHNFSGTGLGKVGCENNIVGPGDRAYFFGDMIF